MAATQGYLDAAVGLYAPVAAGAAYALIAKPHWEGIDELSKVVLRLLLPLLLFTSVYRAREVGAGLAQMGVTAILAAGVSLAASRALTRDRELMLLSAYVNAGYLPIPLAQALWGPEALPLVGFYILFNNAIGNVAAPLLLGKDVRSGLVELAKFPPPYAIALGLLLSHAGIGVPEAALRVASAMGSAAPHLALFTLGAQLATSSAVHLRDALKVAVVRFIVAPAAVWSLSPLYLERGSLAHKVALLESFMPPAVTAAMLCGAYGTSSERGAGVVLLLTTVSIALLPAILPVLTG